MTVDKLEFLNVWKKKTEQPKAWVYLGIKIETL